MKLHSFSYEEFTDMTTEWILKPFEFNVINLIVGPNAGGKSRTLSVIKNLATIFTSQDIPLQVGTYSATFLDNDDKFGYEIDIDKRIIRREKLTINDKPYFERHADGTGKMYNKLLSDFLEFEISQTQTALSKKDAKQYPELLKLFVWAQHIQLLLFNSDLGRLSFGSVNDFLGQNEFTITEPTAAGILALDGHKRFGEVYFNRIITDFKSIGYDVSEFVIGNSVPPGYNKQLEYNKHPVIISVKESDLIPLTDQFSMSTGMYRALVVIIYINYYILGKIPGIILIDDIGEGLDYDRSTKLINLLIDKFKGLDFQLVMTTNDRFVMNNVPLEYWQIIDRKATVVSMYNKQNSPETFADFEYTGLNNFDFFSSGFFKNGFQTAYDEEV